MKWRILEKSLKNELIKIEIFVNRLLKREFIPVELGAFNIEPSSACNLQCRFCAYHKRQTPKISMNNEIFFVGIQQALELGFRRFHLTPCAGELFMDKKIFEKFAFLENHPQVISYHFFTNFTLVDADKLTKLIALKKLERITISIYGHDQNSFIAITQTNIKVYQKLINNLKNLLNHLQQLPFKISFGFRSVFNVPAQSELVILLNEFKQLGIHIHESHGIYNNWGGYISKDDVANLDVHILSDQNFKLGACVKLFDSVQITATGIVNGCACRDVDSNLRIGDLRKIPLKEIISIKNTAYMKIIEAQQQGNFLPVCKSCDYYRSIYHQPKNYRRGKVKTQNLDNYFTR